jgi:2-methylisocitrate lyase-like PEP mutase family enzyme
VPYRGTLGHNFVLQMCPDRASNLFDCGLFACSSLSITSLCPSPTCLWRIGTVPASLQRHVTCVTPRKQQFASHRFGDAPEIVGETIRLAAEVGLVGYTIEDTTGKQDNPLYDVRLAVERIAAAAAAARTLQHSFMLTARAHNLLYASANLDETISRLQAFDKAGADVLFAPGLPDLAAVSLVCAAVSKPVNFMVGIKGKSFSVAELAAAGVRRISLATSLYRAAMTGFLEAAREVKDAGQFGFLDRCVTTPELNKLMQI